MPAYRCRQEHRPARSGCQFVLHRLKSTHDSLVQTRVFLACLIPLALLGWKAYNHALGANPIEVITHATGDWILRFLLITLAITPIRKLTGQLG